MELHLFLDYTASCCSFIDHNIYQLVKAFNIVYYRRCSCPDLLHSWRRPRRCWGWDSPACEPCCCVWLSGSAAASYSGGCTRKRCSSPAGRIGPGSSRPRPRRRLCSPCQNALPSTAGQRRSWCRLSGHTSPAGKLFRATAATPAALCFQRTVIKPFQCWIKSLYLFRNFLFIWKFFRAEFKPSGVNYVAECWRGSLSGCSASDDVSGL